MRRVPCANPERPYPRPWCNPGCPAAIAFIVIPALIALAATTATNCLLIETLFISEAGEHRLAAGAVSAHHAGRYQRHQPLIARHGTRLCRRSSANRRIRRVSLRLARTYSLASELRSQGRIAGNRILDHTEGLEDAQSKAGDRLRRADACDAQSASRFGVCRKPPLSIAR